MDPQTDDDIQNELRTYAVQDKEKCAREYIDALDVPEGIRKHYHRLYTVMTGNEIRQYLRKIWK